METSDLTALIGRLRDALTDLGPMPLAPDVSARLIRENAEIHPDLPPGLIASVVRELESAARPVMISAHGPGTEAFARGRFGFRGRTALVADARSAVASARAGARAIVAIEARDPWWARLLAEPALSVIDDDLIGDARKPSLFVVARQWSEPSGQDRTWWLTDAPGKPFEIEEALLQLGLTGRHALTVGGVGLYQIDGYVQREDARLAQAPGRLAGVIGCVPVAPR